MPYDEDKYNVVAKCTYDEYPDVYKRQVWANASWAGAVAGAVLVPLVVPAGRAAADGGMLSAIAQLQGVVGCEATAIAGCVLLAAAVATARKALIAHLEAA